MKTHLGFLAIGALMLLTGSTTALAADTYKIDSVHTYVVFKVNHLGMTNNYGRFNDISGKIVFDDKDPSKSSIDIEIQAASIDTANQKRDDHLRGPDFFNAKQFPVIAFKSKSVKKTGANTFDITGDLTMHGVTKPLSFVFTKTGEGKDPWGNNRAGGEATFTIKRSDFGMTYSIGPSGDEVTLLVSVEALKQ
ncbi:MAG: YceI family protein [Bdellovibrionota bacterium]